MKAAPLNNPNGTLALWILMGYGVYFLVILSMAMLSFIASLIGFVYGLNYGPVLYTVGTLCAVGGVIGWSVGTLQKLIIETRLGWHASGWVFWSVVGGVIGLTVLSFFAALLPRFTWDYSPAYFMPIFITPVAVCQWWVLRRAVDQAYLWILANIAAGLTFALIPEVFAGHAALVVLLAPMSQAALTGMMLIWLFEQRRRHNRPTSAPVPVPVRTSRPPSVWDEAV
jgi:MFS family permease